MSGSTAWSATNSVPHSNPAAHHVDRASKGDRLPLTVAVKPAGVNQRTGINEQSGPAAAPQLPEGCEAVVSVIGKPPLANVAGRCLS
jgi:hypothetical protein